MNRNVKCWICAHWYTQTPFFFFFTAIKESSYKVAWRSGGGGGLENRNSVLDKSQNTEVACGHQKWRKKSTSTFWQDPPPPPQGASGHVRLNPNSHFLLSVSRCRSEVTVQVPEGSRINCQSQRIQSVNQSIRLYVSKVTLWIQFMNE